MTLRIQKDILQFYVPVYDTKLKRKKKQRLKLTLDMKTKKKATQFSGNKLSEEKLFRLSFGNEYNEEETLGLLRNT